MVTGPSAQPRRYLALWLPFLSADRLRQQEMRSAAPAEALAEQPTVFVEKARGAMRLAAVDRQALALGLMPGLALADARARVPALRAVGMDPVADAACLARIADLCDRYTPAVAIDVTGDPEGERADGLLLDITGCAHLHGGEAGLRADLLDRLGRAGIGARAVVAGTPDAARALARFGGRGTPAIVPPGGEAEAVAPLPVAALGGETEAIRALEDAGLLLLGDLAARPRQPLVARFGAGLVRHLARILGEEDRCITPRRPLPVCLAERRFAEPIARTDDALAVLGELAAEVAGLLERRGEGGRRFEAGFFRVDGRLFRIAVATGRPARAPDMLMRLFRERLDALADPLDPGFGFDLVRLAVPATEPFRAAQADLDGRAVAEEELAALVDRLCVRFGGDAVLGFRPVDSHLPERATRPVRGGPPASDGTVWPLSGPAGPPARPLYMFHPPQPIEALAEVPDGPPLRFRWRRMLHEIVLAEGPERIAPEWWRPEGEEGGRTRDYYRVEDREGRRFWVFREGLYDQGELHGEEGGVPRWFLHGRFA